VRRSLPRLVTLHERHRSKRDRFVILALHDATAKAFEELDAKLAPMVKELWKGQPLPFPILLDATGETVKRYEIRGYLSTWLVDPEGNLQLGSEETLDEILKKEG
jgi:hypothetical protein